MENSHELWTKIRNKYPYIREYLAKALDCEKDENQIFQNRMKIGEDKWNRILEEAIRYATHREDNIIDRKKGKEFPERIIHSMKYSGVLSSGDRHCDTVCDG